MDISQDRHDYGLEGGSFLNLWMQKDKIHKYNEYLTKTLHLCSVKD